MITRGRIYWGLALVVLGAVLLANQLGVLPFTVNFGLFLFGVPALLFLMAFVVDRRQWWALIPGGVLSGLTLMVFNAENHFLRDELAGSVFLFSIGLPFLLIYLIDRRQWWALIPGGVLTTLTAMPLLTMAGWRSEFIAGVFFLGLAAVFLLVRLMTWSNPSMAWAWWPAGVLAAFGAFVLFTGTVAAQVFWPMLLIGIGLFVLARGYLPRRSNKVLSKPDESNGTSLIK